MPISYAARHLHIETLRFLSMREYDVEAVLHDPEVNNVSFSQQISKSLSQSFHPIAISLYFSISL